ncbi:phage gp6-like head-tail connector protein [Pseudomonas aeruginosa]|uniref:head-tail connector protein n=1 Tax=Pseudomonas aeruginosa TaxID=287 RepID=UPI001BD679A4|nr:head-tail connector protein [Pseudomonas aeruginosa]MBS9758445.1 phage gp6-like head-tail connector protein [Pseudomonas aeruginosa]MBW5463720.1 phage gp6-like head-tail connector protein [Pseudomonas aeruginosa]HBO8236488.1 phage gp6-like head-tail connector protein [Pseudomonas aeruginosa]
MLKPELIKAHLRLDDDEFTAQQALLTAYGRAAWRLVENRTGRTLIDVGPVLEGETWADLFAKLPEGSPENAAPLDDDLTLAMLLVVAHWDKNREAVSENGVQTQQALPLAFDALIEPYRWITL